MRVVVYASMNRPYWYNEDTGESSWEVLPFSMVVAAASWLLSEAVPA